MLEGIGRIGAYVQQKNLKTAAKYRIKTGRNLQPSKTEKLQSALQQISKNQSSKHGNSIRTASIKSKLKGGRRLSADEMSYLRENDPDLYRKAKGAQKAREELERDLSSCHTKAEARQALMRAQLKASNEAMADLAAAKGAGGAGGGGAGAASFSGGIADDVSADINADAGAVAANDNVNITAGNVDEPGINTEGVNISSPTASATDGAVNSIEGSDISEASDDVSITDNISKKEAENAAQQIIASVLKEINTLMSEVAGTDNTGKPGDEDSDKGQMNDDASTGTSSASSGSSTDMTSDIIEKLLYKMRAIQNVWDEFTHSKEYKEMPEDYIDGDAKNTKPHRFKNSIADNAVMDIINQYTTSMADGLAFDIGNVDISK